MLHSMFKVYHMILDSNKTKSLNKSGAQYVFNRQLSRSNDFKPMTRGEHDLAKAVTNQRYTLCIAK